jgi:hypothetical protein
MTRFKIRHEGVLGNLHEPRRAAALLHDDRAGATNQPFLRDPVQIAASLLDLGAGFVDILPTQLHQGGAAFRQH